VEIIFYSQEEKLLLFNSGFNFYQMQKSKLCQTRIVPQEEIWRSQDFVAALFVVITRRSVNGTSEYHILLV